VAEVFYPACALAAWVAVGYRLRALRKHGHNPALRTLCTALVFLAATATFATPALARLLDGLICVANLTILSAHVCVVLFSATVLRMLLFWSYPPEEARRRARPLRPIAALIVVALVVLFLLAPLEETTPSLAGRYARYPWVAQYLAVYLGTLAVASAAVARLCWRFAKIAQRPWLRRGLRVAVVSALFGMLFCVCKGAYVTGLWLGVDLRFLEAAAPVIVTVSALLSVGGFTMPAWGPHLDELGARLGRYRAYKQLYPLWLALYQAMPQIALMPAESCRTCPARDLDFLLYRRVIEIRDGQLSLRPFFDNRVAATAARFGRASGLTGKDLDAAVEASVLAAAMRARNNERHVSTAVPDAPGGSDLCSEIASLVPVARAFARSPVVRAVLAATDSTGRPRTTVT